MEIYRSLDSINSTVKSVVTIGTFDGFHRGHQEIINKVTSFARSNNVKSVLITFDPHPRHVIQEDGKLPMLMHIDKKLNFLKHSNLDVVVVIPFDSKFSEIKAVDFLNTIVRKFFNPISIIIGYDHHFGYKREGSPNFLINYGVENNIAIDVVNPISDKDTVISSTHIRQLLKNGHVRRASLELGWVFGFEAIVVHGSGRGKGLGFPTANFIPMDKNQLVPSNGVYFIRARINSENLYGMCNLGLRPTFNEDEFVMEAHFFKLNLNSLYGSKITVDFLERIRDEVKFSSKKDLIEQLTKDKETCISLVQKYN